MRRAEFLKRLDERPDDPSASAAFDAQIHAELDATRAILVTDLSGFTRLTKAHGIVHFLAIFRRCITLAEPCIAAHGGRLLKFAADNLIATFAEPADALATARDLIAAATRDNKALPAERHVRVCCGVGYGSVLLLDDDCFGDDVNVAFKLGEDIAESDEILVTESAAARLQDTDPESALEGPRLVEISGVTLRFFAANW